jgi:hypothetical protein
MPALSERRPVRYRESGAKEAGLSSGRRGQGRRQLPVERAVLVSEILCIDTVEMEMLSDLVPVGV